MNKKLTSSLAALALGSVALLGLSACGDSEQAAKPVATQKAEKPAEKTPTAEPSVDCDDPEVSQEDWNKWCAEDGGEMPETTYPASTDKTWTYTDEMTGCVITYKPVSDKTNHYMQVFEDFLSAHYDMGDYQFYKITIDNTKGSDPCEPESPTVVTEDGEQEDFTGLAYPQEETDSDGMVNELDGYAEFLTACDKLSGHEELMHETLPGVKETSYTVRTGDLKPFTSLYVDGVPAQQK